MWVFVAIDQLMFERRNVVVGIQRFCHQRDELNQEIQAKIALRQELMDELILKETLRW